VLKLEDYLPHQLRQMLTPKEVEKEFGLAIATLKYWRECSKDTGKLVGPLFFNDGNVNLYQRKIIILYINSKMFSGSETSESRETRETTDNSKIKKFSKKNK
tara:strand:- start:135 stop:440 length:306 start_codon:yes stop_codon:yes gene_type:complete